MTIKALDPLALASITTGRSTIGFNKTHEAFEHVMGHPIWTHEMADKALWIRGRDAVLAQFPAMPVNWDGQDYDAFAAKVRSFYGETVDVEEGTETRDKSPLETLQEVAGDRPVIVIAAEEDTTE
jgi:hypothetical protein